ncbi:MAG: hypothetical protein ACI4MH_01305 [Candidatus Coproplasma sp.]
MAIGIKVKKAEPNAGPATSKFFGDPVVPNAWVNNWSDDVIFFCQIRLADLTDYDRENRLPHIGYLYIFLDTEVFPYTPMIYYYEGEPDTVIDDFNSFEPQFSHLTTAFDMEFYETEDDADGIKLLGTPSDWNYDEPMPALFMQYDPLAADMGFLDEIDGFAYFLFVENNDLVNIRLHIERS